MSCSYHHWIDDFHNHVKWWDNTLSIITIHTQTPELSLRHCHLLSKVFSKASGKHPYALIKLGVGGFIAGCTTLPDLFIFFSARLEILYNINFSELSAFIAFCFRPFLLSVITGHYRKHSTFTIFINEFWWWHMLHSHTRWAYCYMINCHTFTFPNFFSSLKVYGYLMLIIV